eukprot:jgi/Mesen1/5860/ME000298S05119
MRRQMRTGGRRCWRASGRSTWTACRSTTTCPTRTAATTRFTRCGRYRWMSRGLSPTSPSFSRRPYRQPWRGFSTSGPSATRRAGTCRASTTSSRRSSLSSSPRSSPMRAATWRPGACRNSLRPPCCAWRPTATGASPSCWTASRTTTHLRSRASSGSCSSSRRSCGGSTSRCRSILRSRAWSSCSLHSAGSTACSSVRSRSCWWPGCGTRTWQRATASQSSWFMLAQASC